MAAHGIDTYKQACAASGHTPHVTFIRPVYFGDDQQQHIRHEVEGFFRHYMHFNASAIDGLMSEGKKAEWRAKGFGFYASGVVEQFRTMTYDQILENGLAFVGTPAEVIVRTLHSSRGKALPALMMVGVLKACRSGAERNVSMQGH